MGAFLSANTASTGAEEGPPLFTDIPASAHGDGGSENGESQRLRTEIAKLIRELRASKHDINIVFTGPICIGVSQFAADFASSLTGGAFRFVEVTNLLHHLAPRDSSLTDAYGKRLDRIETQRRDAVQRFVDSIQTPTPKTGLAEVMHVGDLLRECCLHQFARELEIDELERSRVPPSPATPEPQKLYQFPRFRVYYQNPDDHAMAMARASLDLKYITQEQYESIRMIADSAWGEAMRTRRASNTLYVYVGYDAPTYNQSYASCIEHARKSQNSVQQVYECLREHAKLSKYYLDDLYANTANEIVNKYFSIVLNFEDNTLLSRLHGLVIARDLLSTVLSLQRGGKWGATDVVRVHYLSTSDWLVHRTRRIPKHLANPNPLEKGEIERQFRGGDAPLPRSVRPVPARVQDLRDDEGIPSAPPSKTISSSSAVFVQDPSCSGSSDDEKQQRKVYGTGSLSRAKGVRPVELRAHASDSNIPRAHMLPGQ